MSCNVRIEIPYMWVLSPSTVILQSLDSLNNHGSPTAIWPNCGRDLRKRFSIWHLFYHSPPLHTVACLCGWRLEATPEEGYQMDNAPRNYPFFLLFDRKHSHRIMGHHGVFPGYTAFKWDYRNAEIHMDYCCRCMWRGFINTENWINSIYLL